MFNRSRLTLAITIAACLLVASGASAEPLVSAAPTVTITVKPSDPSNDTSPSFAFEASEPSTFQCKLDEAALAPCISPHSYTALAAGPHNFVVEATNGVDVGQASYSWTIDTTPPSVTITGPPNPSNDTTPSFAFTASEVSTFRCKLDGGIFALCTSPKDYTETLAGGPHNFVVEATDAAGNVALASYGWTIDTTPPTVAITVKPSNPSNNASPSFGFTTTDATSIECRLDGPVFTSCTSPKQYANLSDGVHTFSVRVTDAAGNAAEASHTWTIETGPPTAALTSAPPSSSNSSAATFVFSANEPSSFECTLDDRGFEQCSSPVTYHGLGDGQHAFRVRARDAVGNFSPAVSHTWTIDTTAPETTLSSKPKSVTTATAATFAFAANETGTFECRLDGAPFALCASPKRYARLGRRNHRFEVRAIDAVGNADATPALHGWRIRAAARKASRSALFSPQAGARVTKPPVLRWRRVARARYYNVQVFRGSQKVLSAWPTRTRLRLGARWRFAGRARRLTGGTYRWYVWPGYGAQSARRYGALLGQSTFVVVRSARR
jgi:large repetitive protein